MVNKNIISAIKDYIQVPERIQFIRNSLYHDLLHGPLFTAAPKNEKGEADWGLWTPDCVATFSFDLQEDESLNLDLETLQLFYTSPVANEFRDYLQQLPADLWVEEWSGCVLEDEPQAYENDEGEMEEPCWEDYSMVSGKDIVAALFGETFAREFS